MNDKLDDTMIDYDEIIGEDLLDDAYATLYLNETLRDPNPRVFLRAVRRVAKARKLPMTDLAKKAGIHRRTLYKALSDDGNPAWTTLQSILHQLGFRVSILPGQESA